MRHRLDRPLRAAGVRLPALVLVLALASALAWAWGCGGSKTPTTPPIPTIDIHNGTWRVQQTVTFAGDDSCTTRGTLNQDTTLVLCNVDVVDPGFVDADVTCPVYESDGRNVSYVCRVRVNLGVCYQILEITGSGTISDTTFNLQNTFYTRFAPVNPDDQVNCDLLFGKTVDACTTSVASVGVFVSSDGDTICPPDTSAAAAGMPLQRFVTSQAVAGFR